jgi:hypothetical protein
MSTPRTTGARSRQIGWLNNLILFIFVALKICFAQKGYVVCEEGSGGFETKFVSGVTVTVSAAKSGGLAQRACDGTLAWNGRVLPIASEASQVDIDALGADVGLGVPVVAFQVKNSAADWDMTYRIYSLKKPPRLLRTIVGGDFFRAIDTNLNGRIEIWTADVKAANDFEGLQPGELDFAPTVVLRFERNKLMDVSAEFQPAFDEQIAKVRAELKAQELSDFRSSDGKLALPQSLTLAEATRIHRLRKTKVKVLEIVWSYLYSGRDRQAWQNLAEMWPSGDLARIRAAILNLRARGIRSQIDGVSTRAPRFHFKEHAYVFDAVTESPQGEAGHFPLVDTRPQAILLRRPPPTGSQEALPHSEQMIELVIDAAGKVWSAEPLGNSDKELALAAKGWKFIPAFSGGRAVASRSRINISPAR